ncbi:phosphatase PAP2 family protein [Arthrobacter yangruifuii]|uniref:Phosphatase PAP2 family protein n=1 Tax=Arthrobacter yangruifuii TaxID=2606616 RepID=A0A5N6MTL8_9MICC|nr:phosphatase PAP2 family protein [Arthrobacter yangruifuii]KAD4059671.1 phosphatase PAP2 family protein [Arthrobacter yangruifuii]
MTPDRPQHPAPVENRLMRLLHAVSQAASPRAALLLILAVGLLPALALTLVSAEVYESVTDADGVAGLDRPALDYALTLRTPGADAAVTGFTNLAGTIGMPVIAGVIVLVMCLRWRSWTPLILTAAAAAGSLLMTVSGKALIGRTRPDLADAVPPYESSASFPSGHTLNSLVIAGIIAYLVILHVQTRRAKGAAVLVAAAFTLAVGLSRVYLGHHWLTDVLVAWTLGAAWLAVVITAHQLLRRLPGRQEAAPGSPPRRRH